MGAQPIPRWRANFNCSSSAVLHGPAERLPSGEMGEVIAAGVEIGGYGLVRRVFLVVEVLGAFDILLQAIWIAV